jgi:DNA-binding response OmpR family regulator
VQSRQCIVMIDGLSETEAVLKAVLEPKGLQVNRVRRDFAESDTATTLKPNLIILHGDQTTDPSATALPWDEVPRVIIGTARLPVSAADASDRRQYLQQPFQYSELIQAIERLLQVRQP